jgi:hypothetical protein
MQKSLGKKLFVMVALLLVCGLSSCRQRGASKAGELKETQSSGGQLFVGCAPSVGECQSSCPSRDGQGVRDPERCQESYAPFACTCPGDQQVRPEPPSESTHRFVGCSPSPGECRNSCPTRKIITFQNAEPCEETLDFGCYCSIK